jgi:hypothetical protein
MYLVLLTSINWLSVLITLVIPHGTFILLKMLIFCLTILTVLTFILC